MFLATVPFLPFLDADDVSTIDDCCCLCWQFVFRISPMPTIHRQFFKELFHRPESSIGARLFFIKQILSCVYLVFMPCLLREKFNLSTNFKPKKNVIDDKTQQQKNPFIPTKLTLFRNEKVVPKRKISQSLLGCVECSTNKSPIIYQSCTKITNIHKPNSINLHIKPCAITSLLCSLKQVPIMPQTMYPSMQDIPRICAISHMICLNKIPKNVYQYNQHVHQQCASTDLPQTIHYINTIHSRENIPKLTKPCLKHALQHHLKQSKTNT
jgi:hypothetical protein